MRDPDLMQRADRAAIALEQAWERWRAMHGLGSEPLPPVSSYVGYSLEEPWGQPRVVFGLRADEAELLASLLEGHDCVGSVYSELSARSDWRLPVGGPVSMPGRGYGGRPLSVPAQAPPLETDLLGTGLADDYAIGREPDEDSLIADAREGDADRDEPRQGAVVLGPPRGRGARNARADRARRRAEDAVAGPVDAPLEDVEASWPATDDEPSGSDYMADDDGALQSPPLAPLPDVPEFRDHPEPSTAADADEQGTGTTRRATKAKAPGPGYRGPRYQGYPPRYDAGPGGRSASAGPAVSTDNGDIAADDDGESEPARRSHVAKLSRSARRRTQD
jgi:hypothetical protein